MQYSYSTGNWTVLGGDYVSNAYPIKYERTVSLQISSAGAPIVAFHDPSANNMVTVKKYATGTGEHKANLCAALRVSFATAHYAWSLS